MTERNKHPDDFLRQVKNSLDESVEQIEAATLTRLRAARRTAIEAGQASRQPAWLLPAGGLATVAVVTALAVNLLISTPESAAMPGLEDMALMADSEELEFYEELDFYIWLDNEQNAG